MLINISYLCYFAYLGLLGTSQGNPLVDSHAYQYDQPEDNEDYDYQYPEEDDSGFPGDTNGLSFRPTITTQSNQVVVDNGFTISLPCTVDELPAGMQIIWSKVDQKNTIIAIGDIIQEKEYKSRATIKTTEKGSTLTLGAAKSSDAGKYKCAVALTDNPPEVIHTVSVREQDETLDTEVADAPKTTMEKEDEQQNIKNGKPDAAVVKTDPAGDSEDSYMLEWTVKSSSKVLEFELTVEGATINVGSPVKDGEENDIYAGKHKITALEPSKQYEAMIKAKNEDGWNEATSFIFSTKGTDPNASAKTSSATTQIPTFICVLSAVLPFLLKF